jgi:hypothetical protein
LQQWRETEVSASFPFLIPQMGAHILPLGGQGPLPSPTLALQAVCQESMPSVLPLGDRWN